MEPPTNKLSSSSTAEAVHRRRFDVSDKRAFLREAAAEGGSIAEVGRKYGVSASLLFRWKRELTPPEERRTRSSAVSIVKAQIAELEMRLKSVLEQNAVLRAEVDRAQRDCPRPAADSLNGPRAAAV